MKIERIYLVDCENMGHGQYDVPGNSLVCYFYRDQSYIKHVPRKNSKYFCFDSASGKNALDFCICTVAGKLVRDYGKSVKIIFVSKDTGFDNAVITLRRLGYRAKRVGVEPFGFIELTTLEVCENVYSEWKSRKKRDRTLQVLSSSIGQVITNKQLRKRYIAKYKEQARKEGYC